MTALGSRMLAALATSLLLVLVGLAAFPRAQNPGMVSPPQWDLIEFTPQLFLDGRPTTRP